MTSVAYDPSLPSPSTTDYPTSTDMTAQKTTIVTVVLGILGVLILSGVVVFVLRRRRRQRRRYDEETCSTTPLNSHRRPRLRIRNPRHQEITPFMEERIIDITRPPPSPVMNIAQRRPNGGWEIIETPRSPTPAAISEIEPPPFQRGPSPVPASPTKRSKEKTTRRKLFSMSSQTRRGEIDPDLMTPPPAYSL
ncbi:hypothetical protein JAAARDRAFT_197323 [Jaapia argillacea MUCL 33604]|uniref:receptor protein-tyrosine kinase n=1 Tax=Jaapia argillacea MUCL 33604 TaxID=933084 RepID=A0A067PT44_9AGAM|nr:hypothetical protein JAAARDRAFT_197323 [Jaapia argillacea MUCL 33604]